MENQEDSIDYIQRELDELILKYMNLEKYVQQCRDGAMPHTPEKVYFRKISHALLDGYKYLAKANNVEF